MFPPPWVTLKDSLGDDWLLDMIIILSAIIGASFTNEDVSLSSSTVFLAVPGYQSDVFISMA